MSFKSIVFCLGAFLVVSVLVLQALLLGLPFIAETLVKDRMPASLRDQGLDFDIQHLGLTRLLAADLRIGKDFRADRAELVYGWKGGFRFEKCIISGLSIRLHQDDGQIRFNQNTFPLGGRTGPPPSSPAFSGLDLEKLAPFIPGRIQIKNSTVFIRRPGGDILLPMDIGIQVHGDGPRADARIILRPLGQTLSLAAAIDLKSLITQGPEKGLTRLEAFGKGLHPQALIAHVTDIPEDLVLKGPLDIHIRGRGLGPWAFDISGLSAGKPGFPRIRVDRAEGEVSLPQIEDPAQKRPGPRISAAGDLSLEPPGLPGTRLGFSMTSQTDRAGDRTVSMTLETRAMDALTLNHDLLDRLGLGIDPGGEVSVSRPSLVLNLKGTGKGQAGTLALSIPSLEILSSQGRFEFKRLSMSCSMTAAGWAPFSIDHGRLDIETGPVSFQRAEDRLTIPNARFSARVIPGKIPFTLDLDAVLADIRAVSGQNRIKAGRAGVRGWIEWDRKHPPRAALDTWVNQMRLDLKDFGIKGSGIDFQLPLAFPFEPDTPGGSLKARILQYDGRITTALMARVVRTREMGMAVKGRLKSPQFPGLDLDIDLDLGLDLDRELRVRAGVRAEHFILTQKSLGALVPGTGLAGDMEMDISAHARALLKKGRLDTGARVTVHRGWLDFPDLDLKARGITGQVDLIDLMNLESLPGQSLFVKTVDAGQFRFENGRMRFSIEDGRSLNIENLRVNWCNGLVSTESVRLPAPDETLTLTLYCDRLEMDKLLGQIGAFDAQGGGTLNGRIPVTYSKGNISFDNGFLFSTPGQGGRVFVRDLDRMLKGFPRGTPEFSQLDLAGEALKDFHYKWATLRMNTRGDTLEVLMELDGKPARVLPFEYKKDINSFIRVDASSPGSRFQGVKLDVNLKLPFNRVMKFGNRLRGLLE